MGPSDLAQVLRHLDTPEHADLVVGLDTGDDAAVWRRPDGRALVATADFFTPIVDDARTWGRIAAANAASDVYAMGGTPLFALNLVAWPRDQLPMEQLAEVLSGGSEVARDGRWLVVGGHTVDGREPMYGQAVIGEVDADAILTTAGAQLGQAIVLTKALGTGVVATAVKRGDPADVEPSGRLHEAYTAAVTSMVRLNEAAAAVAIKAGTTAATDVTGFGLLGHLYQVLAASGVGARVEAPAVPVLPGAWELLDAGMVPGGTRRNVDHVRPHLRGRSDDRTVTMLSDAQTSGGLLFTCAPPDADAAVAELVATGHAAAVIGTVTDEPTGAIDIA